MTQLEHELHQACRTVIRFLDHLDEATDENDPLRDIRRRVHAPLRAVLELAIAHAEAQQQRESKTIEQLVAEQGVQPITDIAVLAGAIPDEDVDKFVADIYAERNLDAAAPEMLQALKDADKALALAIRVATRDLYDTREEADAALADHVCIKRIRAAIAKAEGK